MVIILLQFYFQNMNFSTLIRVLNYYFFVSIKFNNYLKTFFFHFLLCIASKFITANYGSFLLASKINEHIMPSSHSILIIIK